LISQNLGRLPIRHELESIRGSYNCSKGCDKQGYFMVHGIFDSDICEAGGALVCFVVLRRKTMKIFL